MVVLTVINPFEGHAIGAEITDPAAIKAIEGSAHAQHVVRTVRDDPPAKPRAK